MAHSQEKVVSVFDFLYVDTKRVELLLSQFGTDGVITELTRATDTTSEIGGGFDIKIASINQKDGEKSGLTRRFDPRWLAPLMFLREAKDIIVRDISEARIGQFVLASGDLSISDLAMLKQLWDVPIVQAAIAKGGRNNQPEDPALDQVKAMLDFIKVLPHGVLASFAEKTGKSIWCALRGDCLIVPSSDLLLSHGAVISGQWNIVGILDALPTVGDEAGPNFVAGPVSDVMKMLGPIARTLLGRPDASYGMTPLLIFREVT